MKTSELTGVALDWAVAKCEKQTASTTTGDQFLYEHRLYLQDFAPSTNWAHGGPIIEREWMHVIPRTSGWACVSKSEISGYGPTPLIAAMRCFVASRLGDEVEIPKELS